MQPQISIARKKIIVPVDIAAREPYSYVRVSTYAQKQQGFSLPHQFALCEQEAAGAGTPIPLANRLSDADSGRSFLRRDLQALLERVRAGRVSVVYCPKVDRLGRNARDCLEILGTFEEHGVRLVLLEPRIDTTTPMGKLFFTLLAAFAEWESEQIKERTWSGKFEQLSQYESTGRLPSAGRNDTAYGLRYVPPAPKGAAPRSPGGDHQQGHWERVPEEARTLLFIYEQAALGQGGQAIADLLIRRATPSPRGKTWHAATILRMVRSRTYLGQLTRRLGGQEFTFAVPRIVPDDLWHLANAQIDANRKTSRRHAAHDYLLSSSKEEPLLRCLVCHEQGHEYMMGGRTNYKPGPGRAWLHYRCYGRGGHTVSAKQIEAAVWEALIGMLTRPSLVLENISKLADAASQQYQDLQAELAGLSERAGEIRAAQARLAEAAAWGKLPADILQQQADDLEAEAQDIAGQISLGHVQIAQAQAEVVPIRDIEDACALLAEGAAGATFSERQWIVRTLVARVYADKERWVLEGRLPTLRAHGTLPGATIAEQRS